MSSLKNITNRGIGCLLAALMVLSSVTMVIPTAFAAEDDADGSTATISVTSDGEEVSSVSVPQDDSVTLTAAPSVSGGELQWEILAEASDNADDEVWADIYGETDEDLVVNYALVSGLMDNSGSVYLRCSAEYDSGTAVSDRVKAKVSYDTDTVAIEQKSKAAANDDDDATVTFTINYLNSDGGKVYSPYTAKFKTDDERSINVTSPSYAGYKPVWIGSVGNSAYEDAVNAGEDAEAVKLTDYTFAEDTVVNVYYTPIEVPYTIEYYFQNVKDNEYTKDESLAVRQTALTGTVIDDEEIDVGLEKRADAEGFTALYHIPTAAAGDGSTIISSYYDRNYYLYTFSLDGGHGTEPIYARYGSSFKVNEPTKAGYQFAGWKLTSATKTDGTDIDVSTIADSQLDCGVSYKMPYQNRIYTATWTQDTTTITVVYWREQVDGSDETSTDKASVTKDGVSYEYWGSRDDVSAKSGTYIDIGNVFVTSSNEADGSTTIGYTTKNKNEMNALTEADKDATGSYADCITSITETMQNESDDDYRDRLNTTSYWKRFDLKTYDKDVFVQGDGSTVVNVYYTRREYTLRIVYAKSILYDSEGDMKSAGVEGTVGEPVYFVYSADTTCFGASGKSPASVEDLNGDGEIDDDDYLIYNLQNNANVSDQSRTGNNKPWGVLTEKPTLKDEYKNKFTLKEIEIESTNSYVSNKGYKWTYYYIEIKGKYGCDISDCFTGNIFNPVKLQSNSISSKNDGNTYNYAYYASVNGEYYVRYSQDNPKNQTIKGTYTRLDDDLLFNLMNTSGSTEASGVAENDFTTVSFLSCWENGGNGVSWNAPCEWIYKYYVQSVNNEKTDKLLTTSNSANIDKIYLDENALLTSYRIGDNHNKTGKVYDDGKWNERPTAIEGFTFVANKGYSYKDSYRLVDPDTGLATTNWKDDGKLKSSVIYYVTDEDGTRSVADTMDSYTVEFYYVRNSYKLQFYNYNAFVSEEDLIENIGVATEDNVSTVNDIPYISVLYQAGLSDYCFEPKYPDDLEEGAYEFKGWYTSPTFEESTKVDWETFTMPASDLKLYAKWSAKEHCARIFDCYQSMVDFQDRAVVSTDSDVYAALQAIDHSVIYEVESGWLQAIDAAYNTLEHNASAEASPDEASSSAAVDSSTPVAVTYEGETRYYVREGGQYYRVNNPNVSGNDDSRFDNSLFTYNGVKYVYVINDNGRTGYVQADGLIGVRHRLHGNVIGSVETPADPAGSGRVFGGWMYINSSETETAFSPQDSPLNSDLDLYADWSSKTNVPFVIHYAKYDGLPSDSSVAVALSDSVDSLENNVTAQYNGVDYVYLTSDDTWHQLIADDYTGYRFDGTTHTFTPATNAEKYEDFKSNYYPTVASHSIQMATTTDAIDNSYTFLYVEVTNMTYTVKYLNADTGDPVADEYVSNNDDNYSIVTEKYASVADYLPDASYKTLTLSVEYDEESLQWVSSSDNVITFYYSYNPSSTTYVVHYMMEDLDQNGSSGTLYEGKYYTEDEGQQLTESTTVDTVISVEPLDFNGFTVLDTAINIYPDVIVDESTTTDDEGNESTTYTYSKGDSITEKLELTDGKFSFTATKYGNDIYIYYDRNTCDYTVYYLKTGANVNSLSDDDYVSSGKKTAMGSGKFGETVTVDAVDFSSLGYMFQSASLSLVLSTVNNDIYFFYTTAQYTVEFKIVGDEKGASLSQTGQTLTRFQILDETDPQTFTSSALTLNDGYEFGGWYYDESCETPVTATTAETEEKAYVDESGYTITPVTDNIPVNNTDGNPTTVFYAKVTPVTEYTYTVAFDPAGGRINGVSTYSSENPYTVTASWLATGLSSLTSTKQTGFAFGGWYYTDSNGEMVQVTDDMTFAEIAEDINASVSVDSDVTINLTAQWTESKVVFHTNYAAYGVTDSSGKVLSDESFREYYFTDGHDYTVGVDGTISFEAIPDSHVNNDWIFAGWYYNTGNDGTTDKALDWDTVFTGSTDLYAHWIKNGDVEKEDDGKQVKNTDGGDVDSYRDFGFVGVQIRNADDDSNYPNKTSDDSAYSSSGLRFITSVSESLLTNLKQLNGKIPQYGYVATSSSILIDALTDQSKYSVDDRALVKDSYTVTSKSSGSQKTLSAKTRDLTSQVGTTQGAGGTTTSNSSTSYSIAADHYNGTGYRLYTMVVTYSDNNQKTKNVCIRSYIDYTDANGVRRTYYNDYADCSGTIKSCKACITSFDAVYNMINGSSGSESE